MQSPVECIINMSSRYNRLMAEPVDGVDGDLTAPVFAPTATDILRELPNKILFWKYENIFVCGVQVVGDNDYYTIQFETVYKHENPAEACALAWLEMNKK